MEFSQDIYEKIEAYLSGDLEGQDLQQFEKMLQSDADLAKEVQFQREMHDFLAETPENDLRKNLAQLRDEIADDEDQPPIWRNWMWLLPIMLLGLGLFFWMPKDKPKVISDSIATNPVSPEPVVSPKDTVVLAPKPPVAPPPKPEPVPVQPPPKSPPTPKTDTPEPTQKVIDIVNPQNQDTVQNFLVPIPDTPDVMILPPMATVLTPPPPPEFVSNEELDFLIDNNTRDSGSALKIDTVSTAFRVKTGEEPIDFRFGGTLTTKENFDNSPVSIYVFSNNPQQFENFQPLFMEAIKLRPVSEGYTFDFQSYYQLNAGLYYFVLMEELEENILYLGKFYVYNE